jgi:hypothetical protein
MKLRRTRTASATTASESGEITTIGSIAPRSRAVIRGQVVRMQARPAAHLPVLVVTIGDSTGAATVVWTGRRAIGGVGLGRWLLVEGVPIHHGTAVEFTNPRYTLLAGPHDAPPTLA